MHLLQMLEDRADRGDFDDDRLQSQSPYALIAFSCSTLSILPGLSSLKCAIASLAVISG